VNIFGGGVTQLFPIDFVEIPRVALEVSGDSNSPIPLGLENGVEMGWFWVTQGHRQCTIR